MTTLGASGLRIPRVGIGCRQLGARVPEDRAVAIIDAAWAAGLNFFDTADVYGAGESERILGRVLHGRRDSCVIATKFRHGKAQPGASRKSIRIALDSSLARLRTDYVDLYQVHAPDPATPIEETIDVLQDLVRHGKILYYGLCNVKAWQVVDAQRVAWSARRSSLVSVQAQMNIVDHRRLDDLREVAGRFGVGLLAASPLARGLLGGRYGGDRAPEAGHPLLSAKGIGYWNPEGAAVADRVRRVAADRGLSSAQVALSALLTYSEVSAVLVGVTCTDHIPADGDVASDLISESDVRYLLGHAEER